MREWYMPKLFRGMKADPNGLPAIGPSSRTLGVRPGIDVPAAGPGDVVLPGQEGMSVAPDDPLLLPIIRRPPGFGGTGRDPVWMIDEADLGADLVYRPDPNRAGHGFVEPSRPMTLDEYQHALAATQPHWVMVTSPGGSTDGD
jgi:hypothetical protein